MKVILSAGIDTFIQYPAQINSFGFENWGNSFATFADDVLYVPTDVVFSSWRGLSKKVDIFFIELSDKRLELICEHEEIIRECKPPLLIGVEHSPINIVDTHRDKLRKGALLAWELCDIIIPLTNASSEYIALFSDVRLAKELAMPIPFAFIQKHQQNIAFASKTATTFHRLAPSSSEYNVFGTLSALTQFDVKIRCPIDMIFFDEVSDVISRLKNGDNIELVEQVAHTDYIFFLESCQFAFQLAMQPSSGRTAALAAVCGRCSVASPYRYQELLFPELVVSSISDVEVKLNCMFSAYKKITHEAYLRAQDLDIESVGKKLQGVL